MADQSTTAPRQTEEIDRMDDEGAAPAATDPAPALADEIVELRKERDALHDRLLRQAAEFDNYRKRVDRERRDIGAVRRRRVPAGPAADHRRFRARAADRSAGRRVVPAGARDHPSRADGYAAQARRDADRGRRRRYSIRRCTRRSRTRRHPDRRDGEVIEEFSARLSAGRQAASPRHGESSESVSKRDYYEILGIPKNAGRSANQERVPQARASVSSRSQPGQQGSRREVQGGRRGLRDPLGSATSARATTDSATPACRRRPAAGSIRRPSPGSRTSSAASSATSSAAAAAAAAPSAAAICATTSRSRSRNRPRASRPTFRFRVSRRATPATARAPRRAAARRRARSARDADSSAFSRGSSPSRARAAGATAPAASSRSRAQTCKGEGRITHERKLTVKIPAGIADGQRLRISGEGEGGHGRRAARRPVRLHRGRAARVLPPRGQQPVVRDSAELHHARAGRQHRRADARRA